MIWLPFIGNNCWNAIEVLLNRNTEKFKSNPNINLQAFNISKPCRVVGALWSSATSDKSTKIRKNNYVITSSDENKDHQKLLCKLKAIVVKEVGEKFKFISPFSYKTTYSLRSLVSSIKYSNNTLIIWS